MTTMPEPLSQHAQPEPSPWDALQAVLHAHYHEPDLEAARVLYSAVAAHRLTGQPVWLMLVAPPQFAIQVSAHDHIRIGDIAKLILKLVCERQRDRITASFEDLNIKITVARNARMKAAVQAFEFRN